MLLSGSILPVVVGMRCPGGGNLRHEGERTHLVDSVEMDSIRIDADTTSLQGNFVMMDSSLMFVDQRYCKIYAFSLGNGRLKGAYSGHGQGPNEMTGIQYGSVVHPADTVMWIVNASNGIYEFTPSNGNVTYKDRVDFAWGDSDKGDYSSPSCYNIMEMSDFGLTLTQIDDSTLLMPVSIINREIGEIESVRYSKGHIFGKVDPETLKVKKLTGEFPEYYASTPLPFFEFFDYAVDDDNGLIYVSHAPDSLIYKCDMEGNRLSTLGFEPKGVNREYTSGFNVADIEAFKKDIEHVGANTGLYYDKGAKLLFRTSMVDMPTGVVIMQVYKDNDLILEQEMPPYFKLLGKCGDAYYGVRFLPEDDGNDAWFTLYRFKLDV